MRVDCVGRDVAGTDTAEVDGHTHGTLHRRPAIRGRDGSTKLSAHVHINPSAKKLDATREKVAASMMSLCVSRCVV